MRKAEKKQTEVQDPKGEKVVVQEDVRIPETDYILEKGEEIVVYPKVEEEKVEEKESLDAIMKKVSNGTELSDSEEKVLKAALDAAKGKDDDDDIVDKIMDKVSKGKELTDKEEKILSAAQDAEKGKKD